MLCDRCKENTATVHGITQVNGVAREVHLCMPCAAEAALPKDFSINDLVKGLMDERQPAYNEACPTCGMDLIAVRRTGRVGCAGCYKTFRTTLAPMLQRIHGRVEHQGKVPRSHVGGAAQTRHELETLRRSIGEAILNEDFELAAQLRDRIRELEKQGGAAQ